MSNKTQKRYAGFDVIDSIGSIEEYKLRKNGLRILLTENHNFNVAGFMVTYLCGSKDESTEFTGFAHLLEHMTFNETKSDKKQNFFVQFEEMGAKLNATTWKDRTNYFEILPPEHLEIAANAEAKRMNSVKISPKNLFFEKSVVLNELDWGENSPSQVLEKQVWATAFLAHPYGHSTIGWRSIVENATAKNLQKFYDAYYRPENAFVTIVGDIEKKEALALIKKYFEKIENPKEKSSEMSIKEPEQRGPKRIIVKKKSKTKIIQISYKMPPASSPDIYKLDILSKILGEKITSRLHKKLIETNKATKNEVSAWPFKDGGLFTITTTLASETKHQEVEEIILAEVEKIKNRGISKNELDIAKNILISEYEFSKDGVESMLDVINEFIATVGWSNFAKYKKEVQKVDLKGVKRVAREYLTEDNKTTGWFIPQK